MDRGLRCARVRHDIEQALDIAAAHPMAYAGRIELRAFWPLAEGDGGEAEVRHVRLRRPGPQRGRRGGGPAARDWFGAARGVYQQGVRLQSIDDATVVRMRDGELLVTDGPFTESKEWIAGFAILEAPDLDDGDRDRGPQPDGVRGPDRAPADPLDGRAGRLIEERLAEVVAAERLRIVAGLVRRTVTGTWPRTAYQDAVERALRRWPLDGIPDNPAAWLTTAAHRRALDVLRRRRLEQDKCGSWRRWPISVRPAARGRGVRRPAGLLFACCHPALPLAGRVALTLKTVTGLPTREIARAFLVTEATMSKRLLRTSRRSRTRASASGCQPAHRLAERTGGVLAVVYLLFNEGYAATRGATRDRTSRRRRSGWPGCSRRCCPTTTRRRTPRAAPAAALASGCPGRR